MKSIAEDYIKYPESKLQGRSLLAYNWLEGNSGRLLDAGCSYGYTTKYFHDKADEVYGIDLNPEQVEVARARYNDINFQIKPIEDTGFPDEFFDKIVFLDVLEHTNDKIKSLSELHRILKRGGKLILSTPHNGIFTLMDPYNYGFYLKKYLPFIYKPLFKMIRKSKGMAADDNPEHLQKHWHYSEATLRKMLKQSDFSDNYKVEKVYKSGLFLEPAAINLESILNIIASADLTRKMTKPLFNMAMKDNMINYGIFSYNIILKVKKI